MRTELHFILLYNGSAKLFDSVVIRCCTFRLIQKWWYVIILFRIFQITTWIWSTISDFHFDLNIKRNQLNSEHELLIIGPGPKPWYYRHHASQTDCCIVDFFFLSSKVMLSLKDTVLPWSYLLKKRKKVWYFVSFIQLSLFAFRTFVKILWCFKDSSSYTLLS